MNKAYTRIDWENEPSTNTPINETNLNKMDAALDELDNRVIAQDTSKADKTEVSTLISNVEFDESTGIITVTRKNGSSFTIDTKLEKIAINFTYDKDTQQIILTLIDGTKQYIDLSALITQYEFLDSDTIMFVVQSDGKIKAEVLDGSITESKLQPNYLATIKVEVAKAEASATAAATSEANALASENAAKTSETNAKTSETNAKNSEENASTSADTASAKATEAGNSANAAATSATNASSSAITATNKATAAANSATSASKSADTATNKASEASTSATNANTYATKSKSYAIGGTGTRENEDIDNAKYYYEKAKQTDIGQISLKVDEINSNLSNQGILTFKKWTQGYYDGISGTFVTDGYVTTDKFNVNSAEETIKGVYENTHNVTRWGLLFWNGERYVSRSFTNSAEKFFPIPDEANCAQIVIQYPGITPSTAGVAEIVRSEYIDNAIADIDKLKDDLSASNAGAHNSVYRGKYLGNALTTEQKTQISAGTFNDLYIGDYWTIGGVNYRIASFDYWLNSGDTNCTTHHVVIVPDTCLYNAQMNTSNITTGAYVGSAMYTSNLEQAKTIINNAFGSANILSHREYLANATKSTTDPTYESAGSWYDSTVELMNERMVHGADVFHNIKVNGAIPTNNTIDKSQLPLFALEPSRICNRASWWLRDVVSAASFALVDNNGLAYYSNASDSRGVRPVFAIKG